jgi:hypothetical protein
MGSKWLKPALSIVAVTLLAALSAHASDEKKYQARQHGYEHGYRDGFQHGREDRERHASLKFETDDYKHADRGYDKYMGDHDKYKEGYRTGYQAGYTDAFYGRRGRFVEIYGPPDSAEGRSYYPDDYVFESRSGGYPDIGYDTGYRDGVQAGEKDQAEHHKFDPADHDRYRDSDHDYRSSFGDKELYKRSYREGFMRGYQDGYGRWR